MSGSRSQTSSWESLPFVWTCVALQWITTPWSNSSSSRTIEGAALLKFQVALDSSCFLIGVWGLCVFVSRVCFFWFGLWSVTTTRETQMITATTCLLILHAVEVASRTKGQGSCQGLQTKSTLRRVYTSWVAHLLNDISFGVTGGHCVLHDKTCHISVTSEECCDLLVTCHCAMRPWAISRQSGEVRTIICGQWSFLRITQCLSSSPCLLADSRIAKQVRSQCIGVTIAWQINESYLPDQYVVSCWEDIFAFGSPCCPFSILNCKRAPNWNPFLEEDAQPFLSGARHIRDLAGDGSLYGFL